MLVLVEQYRQMFADVARAVEDAVQQPRAQPQRLPTQRAVAFVVDPCALKFVYLQSIPMTESLFSACLLALLYFTVRFRDTQGWGAVAGAGVAACAATL